MAQPSTFGTLLRHSKFASYDPAISQVYTAPMAHIHRGDFGFKRPMPRMARKRAATIVVSSIDTPEYQTAWSDVESETKFVARFDESGTTPSVRGNWSSKSINSSWTTDSEFDRTTKSDGSEAYSAPNLSYHTMPPKKFARFVEKTRELRPEFYEYLEAKRKESNAARVLAQEKAVAYNRLHYGSSTKVPPPKLETEPINLYTSAQLPHHSQTGQDAQTRRTRAADGPRNFLSARTMTKLLKQGSKEISPIPHRLAGLAYSHPSKLQNVLTAEALPGYVFPTANYSGGYLAEPTHEIAGAIARPQSNAAALKGFLHHTQTGYVTLVGGSWTGEIAGSDVFDKPTGSMAKDERAHHFEFFRQSSPTYNAKSGNNGRGEFRLARSELLDPPLVVQDSNIARQLSVRGSRHSGSQKEPVPGLSVHRSFNAKVEPWGTIKDIVMNPHPVGTPAYASNVESYTTTPQQTLRKSPVPSYGSVASQRQEPAKPQNKAALTNTLEKLLTLGGGQGAKRS